MAALTRSFPFDTGAGGNVTEAQWREMAKHWVSDGLISTVGSGMAVTATTGMVLQVATGAAFIQGHYGALDAAANVTVSAAHATLGRIDRVVLRLDAVGNAITAEVVAGTPHASPTAPALTQTSATWEISLATVAVAATTTTIVSGNLTDVRTLITPFNGSLPSSAPPVLSSATSSVGTSTGPARSDHNHGIGTPSAPPVLTGATSAAGSSGTPARSDHAHGIDAYSAWTSYTPAWKGSASDPAIGNGALTGFYLLMGKTLFLIVRMVAGSTTTFGSGYWTFGLPGALTPAHIWVACVSGLVFDASAGAQWPVVALGLYGPSQPMLPYTATAVADNRASSLSSTGPMTWATSDELNLTAVLEVA